MYCKVCVCTETKADLEKNCIGILLGGRKVLSWVLTVHPNPGIEGPVIVGGQITIMDPLSGSGRT